MSAPRTMAILTSREARRAVSLARVLFRYALDSRFGLSPIALDGFAQCVVVELPQEVNEGRGIEFVVAVNDSRVDTHHPERVLGVVLLMGQDCSAGELAVPVAREFSIVSCALGMKFTESCLLVWKI